MAAPANEVKIPASAATSQGQMTSQTRQSTTARPTHDDIAKRAFEIYVHNGCKQGLCEQDWEQAERELTWPSQSREVSGS